MNTTSKGVGSPRLSEQTTLILESDGTIPHFNPENDQHCEAVMEMVEEEFNDLLVIDPLLPAVVPFAEWRKNLSKEERDEKCPECRNTGKTDCPECEGDGYHVREDIPCDLCNGTGTHDCECEGHGQAFATYKHEMREEMEAYLSHQEAYCENTK